jgi:hypothetical protein
MLVALSLSTIPDTFNQALANFCSPGVFGPHTGSKTPDFAYSLGLNPSAGTVRDRLPIRVTRVETPPTYGGSGISYSGANYSNSAREIWIECSRNYATSTATVQYTSRHGPGKPVACAENNTYCLTFSPQRISSCRTWAMWRLKLVLVVLWGGILVKIMILWRCCVWRGGVTCFGRIIMDGRRRVRRWLMGRLSLGKKVMFLRLELWFGN